jgi:hypothetical protein
LSLGVVRFVAHLSILRHLTSTLTGAASECEPAVRSNMQLDSDQHALPGSRPPSVDDPIGAL